MIVEHTGNSIGFAQQGAKSIKSIGENCGKMGFVDTTKTVLILTKLQNSYGNRLEYCV
jgi:hypothetical protein